MVSDTTITVITCIFTFMFSVSVSIFMSGRQWGRVETQLKDLQQDRVRQSDITVLRESLSRIDGMFVLTLKDTDRK